MLNPQKPIVKIGTIIIVESSILNPKLGEVLSVDKNQVRIQVKQGKQITCSFGEIERFIGV